MSSSEEKQDTLEIGKRLKELEKEIENIKKVLSAASLEDIKQRLDDLEDIVMVENALTVELKKMMEELKTEERKITELKDAIEQEGKSSGETSILLLEEMKALKDRIEKLEASMTTGQRKEFEKLQNEIAAKLADFNTMLVKINSERLAIENALAKMKSEIAVLNTALENKKAVLAEVLKTKTTGRRELEIEKRVYNIEKEVAAIKSAVMQPDERTLPLEIDELIRRISFLENRLMEIEKIVKETKLSPVIIE